MGWLSQRLGAYIGVHEIHRRYTRRLSNDAVYRRDLKREADRAAAGNDVSIFIKVPAARLARSTLLYVFHSIFSLLSMQGIYFALCVLLDVLYAEKPIAKFWVLETVARMPYFAYLSVLHLYESLGLWRQGSELQKLHFAEGW